VIIRGFTDSYVENEFHPTLVETVWVHELDQSGLYQIRKFQVLSPVTQAPVVVGVRQTNTKKLVFECIETVTDIKCMGKRISFIPAWPLNGRVELTEPILNNIIDKEISLYNKISRRNHLLYGAATYTPYISSDMPQDRFEEIVDAGLGTWIHLDKGDEAGILATPTEALVDMDRAIASTIEEMAKLGIRMLTPESAQSGVALEIRNASQTAQLGTLNSKVCNVLRQIIAFMITWKYGKEVLAKDIELTLSEDFNPAPLGDTWLRLATEWYQNGLIPRSAWLRILKQNEMLDSTYDDDKAQEEIVEDESLVPAGTTPQNEKYAQQQLSMQSMEKGMKEVPKQKKE
jgi:hypothetical protein